MANKSIISHGVAYMLLVLLASMEVEGAPKKAAKKTGAIPGSEEKPADTKVKKAVERVKQSLKEQIAKESSIGGKPLTPAQIDKLDAVSFRNLDGAGEFYYVKLLVNEGKNQSYWQAMIHKEDSTKYLPAMSVWGIKN